MFEINHICFRKQNDDNVRICLVTVYPILFFLRIWLSVNV